MDTELSRLLEQLRRHVECHPSCADTVAGIGQWWLKEPLPRHAEGRLVDALETLVAEGLLERHRNADGTSLYVAAGTPTTRQTPTGAKNHE